MNNMTLMEWEETVSRKWFEVKNHQFFRIGCAAVAALLVITYGICVYRNNHYFESFYPEVVEYPMNTRIELGENFMEMGTATGFFMTVNDAYVTDVDSFIEDYQLDHDEVMRFFEAGEDEKGNTAYMLPESLVIVNVNVENVDCSQSEEDLQKSGGVRKGIYFNDVSLCGVDWYTMLDPFITGMVNESGSWVADFDPGQSHEMTLVYPVMNKISDWNKATKQGIYLHVTYGPTVIKAMLDLGK